MAKKKEVVAADLEEQKALAMASDYGADGDDGFEETDTDSFSVPRLKLLQKMSPACDEDDDAYVEGAKAGAWLETSTGLVFDKTDGVLVVPCHFRRVFIEWEIKEGGGQVFVREHNAAIGIQLMSNTTQDDKYRDIMASGNMLQDTRVHYVLLMDENGSVITPAVMSLSRTQTTPSKNWMNKMRSTKLPNSTKGAAMFAQVYQLTSMVKTKDDNSWSVMKEKFVDFIFNKFPDNHAEVFKAAKSFREMIVSGEAKVVHEVDTASTTTSEGSEEF